MTAPVSTAADDLAEGLKDIANACNGYDKAASYADGPVREIFVSRKIRRLMRNSGVNFQELIGDTVIDAVADRLKILDVKVDNETASTAVDAVDKANALALVRPQVNRLTCKLGDYYLFAWPRADGSMQVVMVDPRQARLFYEPDDPMTPRFGIRWWVTADKRKRVDLLYADRVESYISSDKDPHAREASQFVPYTVEGNDSNVVMHEFGRPPLFHFSTDLPGEYGRPEHKSFYATQDILLKLALGHMVTVDYTTLPLRWAIMNDDSDTTEAEDQDDTVFRYRNDSADPAQRTKQRESKSSLRSSEGDVWMQRGVKEFGQFEPASPAGFIDPARFHLQIGATASSTPLWYFEGFTQPPAGIALRTGMEPLLEKTRARLATLDHAWIAFYTTILRAMGFRDVTVTLTWAPVEPKDEAETWATAKAKQDAGVPQDVTLIEGGYDEEIVQKWTTEGTSGLPERLVMLGQVGDFLASAATAVAGGSATPEQIRAILDRIVGPIDEPTGGDGGD